MHSAYALSAKADRLLPQAFNEEDLMEALGSRVHVITEPDAKGGFLGARLDHLRALCASDDRYVWLNQYTNPECEMDTSRPVPGGAAGRGAGSRSDMTGRPPRPPRVAR